MIYFVYRYLRAVQINFVVVVVVVVVTSGLKILALKTLPCYGDQNWMHEQNLTILKTKARIKNNYPSPERFATLRRKLSRTGWFCTLLYKFLDVKWFRKHFLLCRSKVLEGPLQIIISKVPYLLE